MLVSVVVVVVGVIVVVFKFGVGLWDDAARLNRQEGGGGECW